MLIDTEGPPAALMAQELEWDTERRVLEYSLATRFLKTMNRKGRRRHILEPTDREQLDKLDERVRTVFDFAPLSHNQISELKSVFDAHDRDKSGRLGKDVLASGAEQVGCDHCTCSPCAVAIPVVSESKVFPDKVKGEGAVRPRA